MLLKLVFWWYLMQYSVHGLTTHSRYNEKNSNMVPINKLDKDIQGKPNDQRLSNFIGADKNNMMAANNKQPNYNSLSRQKIPNNKEQKIKQLTEIVGQKLPNMKEPNKMYFNMNQIKNSGDGPSNMKEPNKTQFNNNQGKPSGEESPNVNESNKLRPNKNQGKPSGEGSPYVQEPEKPQPNKNQGEPSGEGSLNVNESNKLRPNKNQGKPSGEGSPYVQEPEKSQPNKNQDKPSGEGSPYVQMPNKTKPNKNQGNSSDEGSPNAQEPNKTQPNKNQGEPSGEGSLNVNESNKLRPNKNQGKPSGEGSPYVQEPEKSQPNKNQGKPSGEGSPYVNESNKLRPNKNQGKPSGEGSPYVQEPEKSQPNKNQDKPSGEGAPYVQMPNKTKPNKNQGNSSDEGSPNAQEPNKTQPNKNQGMPSGGESPNQNETTGQKLSQVTEPKNKEPDMGSLNDACSSNKSLHSKNDIIVMINYVYNQLSIDEQIREFYQTHAMALRDKHIQDLQKFNKRFHNQPQHLKHVLQSLSNVRMQLIVPNVNKIAKLLTDNSQMDKVIEEKKDRLSHLTKKLKKYERLCSFNCEKEEEERHLFKRNVQDEYFCSSIEDLYNKINKRLSLFVEKFNDQSNNWFSKENDMYHIKIANIKNKLKDKGLEMFGRTMYDILYLQDEYHHFVKNLNVSSLEIEINLAKNLSIQVDSKLLELNEHIESYGKYCRNCGGESLTRNVRKAAGHPEKMEHIRNKSETLVDSLIDDKFNKTVMRVYKDWNTIFENLNELINKTEVENPRTGNFKSIQEDVMKMIVKEREVLKNLKVTTSDMMTKKAFNWVKFLRELLKVIIEIIQYIVGLQ